MRTSSCNATADTECKACIGGESFSSTFSSAECRTCKTCVASDKEVTLADCTPATDTLCLTCPSGTYVNTTEGKCRPCSFCGTGKKMITPCSDTADSTCANVLCRDFPSAPHTSIAPDCNTRARCEKFTAVGCTLQRAATAASQTTCGLYTAVATVSCTNGFQVMD